MKRQGQFRLGMKKHLNKAFALYSTKVNKQIIKNNKEEKC